MAKKLFVGNLPHSLRDETLQEIFADHGDVVSATVIIDRDTGRSKGFGFVEMANDQQAEAAIAALNGFEVEGRALTVNEARPKEDRPRSGGPGGRPSFGRPQQAGRGGRPGGNSGGFNRR